MRNSPGARQRHCLRGLSPRPGRSHDGVCCIASRPCAMHATSANPRPDRICSAWRPCAQHRCVAVTDTAAVTATVRCGCGLQRCAKCPLRRYLQIHRSGPARRGAGATRTDSCNWAPPCPIRQGRLPPKMQDAQTPEQCAQSSSAAASRPCWRIRFSWRASSIEARMARTSARLVSNLKRPVSALSGRNSPFSNSAHISSP